MLVKFLDGTSREIANLRSADLKEAKGLESFVIAAEPSQSDKAWGLIASLGFLLTVLIIWMGMS